MGKHKTVPALNEYKSQVFANLTQIILSKPDLAFSRLDSPFVINTNANNYQVGQHCFKFFETESVNSSSSSLGR